jgi:histidinol phosphatase-like enzyme
MLVATKGGLTRPRGDWIADGRARHLGAACEASRRALGVERIDLYQLHAPDPRTPFSTSVRALAALQRDGLIEHVGLCNVNVGQIEEARRITDIAAVQVELSVWHDDSFLSGAGKSTAAGKFVENGYTRLNCDEDGGSLRGLLPSLDRLIESGCDGVLSRSRRSAAEKGYGPFSNGPDGEKGPYPFSTDDVEVFSERGEVLRRYAQDGWRILGLGWQPDIAQGVVTAEQVEAGYRRMQERLGVAMDVLYCPHGGGPPICWCRKPLPGLGIVFIQRYRLDPSQCILVGNGPLDPGFARRLGFQYRDAGEFFAPTTAAGLENNAG